MLVITAALGNPVVPDVYMYTKGSLSPRLCLSDTLVVEWTFRPADREDAVDGDLGCSSRV